MVKLQNCNCQRKIPAHADQKHPETGRTVTYGETSCSTEAHARGVGQKVAAFSFYMDEMNPRTRGRGYFQGIQANLDLMLKYYPGWRMRLYFDLEENDPNMEKLCDLACNYDILDLCYAGQLPGVPMKDTRKVFAMIWRFFPTRSTLRYGTLCTFWQAKYLNSTPNCTTINKVIVDDVCSRLTWL